MTLIALLGAFCTLTFGMSLLVKGLGKLSQSSSRSVKHKRSHAPLNVMLHAPSHPIPLQAAKSVFRLLDELDGKTSAQLLSLNEEEKIRGRSLSTTFEEQEHPRQLSTHGLLAAATQDHLPSSFVVEAHRLFSKVHVRHLAKPIEFVIAFNVLPNDQSVTLNDHHLGPHSERSEGSITLLPEQDIDQVKNDLSLLMISLGQRAKELTRSQRQLKRGRLFSWIQIALAICLISPAILSGRASFLLYSLPPLTDLNTWELERLEETTSRYLEVKQAFTALDLQLVTTEQLNTDLYALYEAHLTLVRQDLIHYTEALTDLDMLKYRKAERRWIRLLKSWGALSDLVNQISPSSQYQKVRDELKSVLDHLLWLRHRLNDATAVKTIAQAPDPHLIASRSKWKPKCDHSGDLLSCRLSSLDYQLLTVELVAYTPLILQQLNKSKGAQELVVNVDTAETLSDYHLHDTLKILSQWWTLAQEESLSEELSLPLIHMIRVHWRKALNQLNSSHFKPTVDEASLKQLKSYLSLLKRHRTLQHTLPKELAPPQALLEREETWLETSGLLLAQSLGQLDEVVRQRAYQIISDLTLVLDDVWQKRVQLAIQSSHWVIRVNNALTHHELSTLQRHLGLGRDQLSALNSSPAFEGSNELRERWAIMIEEFETWLNPHPVLVRLDQLTCQQTAVQVAEGSRAWYSPKRYLDLERLYFKITSSEQVVALEEGDRAQLMWSPDLDMQSEVFERDGEFDHKVVQGKRDDTLIGEAKTLSWRWLPSEKFTLPINQEGSCHALITLFDQRPDWLHPELLHGPLDLPAHHK